MISSKNFITTFVPFLLLIASKSKKLDLVSVELSLEEKALGFKELILGLYETSKLENNLDYLLFFIKKDNGKEKKVSLSFKKKQNESFYMINHFYEREDGELSRKHLSLQNNLFEIFPSLETIDLTGNSEVGLRNFTISKDLKNLILKDTKLNQIPDSLIPEINSLEKLDISKNKGLQSKLGANVNLKNLKYLNISQNPAIDVQKYLSFCSRKLETLDASSSSLFSIPDLSEFDNLKLLYLSSNLLTEIPDSLTKLTSLKYLDLSNNPITHLHESIFNYCQSEFVINLKNNYLKKCPVYQKLKDHPDFYSFKSKDIFFTKKAYRKALAALADLTLKSKSSENWNVENLFKLNVSAFPRDNLTFDEISKKLKQVSLTSLSIPFEETAQENINSILKYIKNLKRKQILSFIQNSLAYYYNEQAENFYEIYNQLQKSFSRLSSLLDYFGNAENIFSFIRDISKVIKDKIGDKELLKKIQNTEFDILSMFYYENSFENFVKKQLVIFKSKTFKKNINLSTKKYRCAENRLTDVLGLGTKHLSEKYHFPHLYSLKFDQFFNKLTVEKFLETIYHNFDKDENFKKIVVFILKKDIRYSKKITEETVFTKSILDKLVLDALTNLNLVEKSNQVN